MTPEEKNKVLFMNLVGMLHALAWQQLGKVANPVDGKIEQNLEGARGLIDTLEMIEAKTDGKLDADEKRFLDELLKELRLNYVDESAKSPNDKPSEDAGSAKG